MKDAIIAMLISASPFGEARVGLPFALLHGIHPIVAYVICTAANLLVFPITIWFMNHLNQRLFKLPSYRKLAVNIGQRAKLKVGGTLRRHGALGLLLFVMIPLPITGAYMGSLAAYILKVDRKKAFWAISAGVVISCLIMVTGAHFSLMGLQLF